MLLIGGCAVTKQPAETSIGPYTKFSGRLLVIDASRRWQVLIDWDGTPEQGRVRLLHGASNRIVNIEWADHSIRFQDNLALQHGWRLISPQQLQELGIILPPQQIALILTGNLPPSFARRGDGEWEGNFNATHLRIQWFPESRRLELTDVTHGRKAILTIDS